MVGRLTDASNATLLVQVSAAGYDHPAVYKPIAGERPLWDFPAGTLAHREVAAFVLSRAGGCDVVPPTVLREDAPFGPGSLQWWIDAGTDADGDPLAPEPGAGLIDLFRPDAVPTGWRAVLEATDGDGEPIVLAHADEGVLRSIAVFDLVANNADRKAGHVLAGALQAPGTPRSASPVGVAPAVSPRHVRGVDHGLTFHAEPKLRTVLWGWAGLPLPDDEADRLDVLAGALAAEGLKAALGSLLEPQESRALLARVESLRRRGRFPTPAPGLPPIPWPPF